MAVAAQARPPRLDSRRPRHRRMRSRLTGIAFVLPGLALVGLVLAYPLIQLVHLSLIQSLGDLSIYVGLDNFRVVRDDPVFQSAVRHNIYLLLCAPAMVAVSFVLAVLLSEQHRGRQFFQTALFIPYVIAIPVIGIVFSNMLTKEGALNSTLGDIGLGFLRQDWLGDQQLALVSLGLVIIWRESAFGILLFLARMLSISPELYEAARLDGARWWQLHRHITIPEVSRVAGLYFTISIITITAWVFAYVFVMTNGGPGNATITADLYVYQQAFGSGQQNVASAAAILLFALTIIGLAIVAVSVRVVQRIR
jgi:ABC-type sugar transport system permease subunit